MKSVRTAPVTIVFSSGAVSSPVVVAVVVAAVVAAAQLGPHLLRTLVAQVGTAEHEDRREQERQELTEQQDRGQDDQQLVAQRSDGDAPDDRQLAVRCQAVHVLRRDRGVVDDDPRRLHTRPAGGRPDVVDRGGRGARQHPDVVEQRYESTRHGTSFRSVSTCVPS
jgi:hypothetical protein